MTTRFRHLLQNILIIGSLLLGNLLLAAAPAGVAAQVPPGDHLSYGAQTGSPPVSLDALQGPPGCTTGCTRHWDSGLDAGDPVATNAGAYHFTLPLLSLGGPMDLNFTLRYRSDFEQVSYHFSEAGVPASFWWTPLENLEWWFVAVTFQLSNADALTYYKKDGKWVPPDPGDSFYEPYPARWVLQETPGYFYLMDPVRGWVHIFDKGSRIVCIVDRNGNRLKYTYADEKATNPIRIDDGLGRVLNLTYQPIGHKDALVRVTDQAGRQVTLTYDDPRTLRSVADAAGRVTTLHYNESYKVTSVEQPDGSTPYVQTYSDSATDRVVSQTDPYSNTTNFTYASAARVTVTRPDGTDQIYEHYGWYGRPRSLTDPTGKTMQYGRDETTQQLTSVTGRLGHTASVTYHPETGRVASYTDPKGNTTTLTYTPQEQAVTNPISTTDTVTFTFYNLTRITYADDTHDDLTYDSKGNLLSHTDRRGRTWTFTYNSRGQVLTATNPAGGVITNTYNADGTLASSTTSDVGVTTFGYDAYKRLHEIRRPNGKTVILDYDLSDRLLSVTDELGQITRFSYNANGDLTGFVNPLGETVTYSRDLLARVSSRTDPLGHKRSFTYDVMGRLSSLTDRNGNTMTLEYDAHGWLTGITDPTGQKTTIAYDDEGAPLTITTPLGAVTRLQHDEMGFVTEVTDPLGATSHFTYDKMGRLIEKIDPLGRSTSYTYSADGWLVGADGPGPGAAAYAYDDSGALARITDPRGKHWDFAYTPMGRLRSHTDPLGRQWQFSYDTLGRLSKKTYPDGGTASYAYDAANRMTRITYTDGLSLHYAYDGAGRLLRTHALTLAYDQRGDTIRSRDQDGTTCEATYDAGRRLHTVTYPSAGGGTSGVTTVTYTYDARNLLTRVEDDLSGAWLTFTYNADGRLTEINRSNGVNTVYSYDAAGRVTRVQDSGLADQQYTLNAAGEPVRISRSLPLDPPPLGRDTSLTYDDANQINAPGYAYDARGRQVAAPGKHFAYDNANRLVSITAGRTVELSYNGLGGLRTRTVGGATTTYYHNYALLLDPIVAERTDKGYKRFYVYTPAGALLYSIDPGTQQVRFYHYDRMGSTLFLTDGTGNITDAYAYDPYGNLLGHIGDSDQPFTYIGRYGVRWEPVGGLYDMRARAYDPRAARFLTRDPLWPGLMNPQTLNPYQYAVQSPLHYLDPGGLWPSYPPSQGMFKPAWDDSSDNETLHGSPPLFRPPAVSPYATTTVDQMNNAGAYVEGLMRLANMANLHQVADALSTYGTALTVATGILDGALSTYTLVTQGAAGHYGTYYDAPGARLVRILTGNAVDNTAQVDRDLHQPWIIGYVFPNLTRLGAEIGILVGEAGSGAASPYIINSSYCIGSQSSLSSTGSGTHVAPLYPPNHQPTEHWLGPQHTVYE